MQSAIPADHTLLLERRSHSQLPIPANLCVSVNMRAIACAVVEASTAAAASSARLARAAAVCSRLAAATVRCLNSSTSRSVTPDSERLATVNTACTWPSKLTGNHAALANADPGPDDARPESRPSPVLSTAVPVMKTASVWVTACSPPTRLTWRGTAGTRNTSQSLLGQDIDTHLIDRADPHRLLSQHRQNSVMLGIDLSERLLSADKQSHRVGTQSHRRGGWVDARVGNRRRHLRTIGRPSGHLTT